MDLDTLTASQRITWALEHAPGPAALTTSFGIQSAVLLHLATRIEPGLPVIFIDTGHLFEETYRHADQLRLELGLDVRVYQPRVSSAWTQARHGKLWEQGAEGLDHYHRIHKIEPLNRALDELGVGTWISGRRREQSDTRSQLQVLEDKGSRWKLNPIVDWTDAQVEAYVREHRLPQHPLALQGYVSVGDRHDTVPLKPGMRAEDTRHFGIKRECGIHLG